MVSLSVSPVDDTILSGSLDRTARLWDLRAPDCLGLMQCQVKFLHIVLGGLELLNYLKINWYWV